MIKKKIVRLPEFKKYRQLKNILLEMIQDHEDRYVLYEDVWNDGHKQLYDNFISLSNELIDVFEEIVTKELKYQLPSLLDDTVEFRL